MDEVNDLDKLIKLKAYNKAGAEHWFSLSVGAEEAKRYMPIYESGFKEADTLGFVDWLITYFRRCSTKKGFWYQKRYEPEEYYTATAVSTEELYVRYLNKVAPYKNL